MTEVVYFDSCWHGAPDLAALAVAQEANVLGPRILDGVAYVAVRSAAPLPLPAGLAVTGPQLSAALVGVWA